MKKNKYINLIKDILVFTLGSLGSKIILFLMVPLYTNYLSSEEYGTTELIYTFAQLIIPLVSLVIYDGVVRFGLSHSANKENVLKCGFLILTIGSFFTILFTQFLELYDELAEWKFFICAYVIFSMFLSLFQNYLKVRSKNLLYSLVSIIQTLSLAVLNILFLVIKNLGITGYLYAMLGSQLISIIICLIFGKIGYAIIKGKIDIVLLKQMVIYSAPLIINNISWWVIHSSDKIMIEIMISTAALGIYTVSTKIPSLINVITSIFQQAWGISTIKEVEETNSSDFYENIFSFLHLLVIGLSIFLILVIKPFMSIYVGIDFYESWQYIPLLLVGAAFSTISSFYGCLYGAIKKSVNSMVTTLISAIINIIVNYIGIIYLGIWGAVIGTAVSYISIAVIRMVDCQRYFKMKINFVLLVINSTILIAQAILVSLGLNIYVVSSIAFVLFMCINAKKIINMLQKIIIKIKEKKCLKTD